MSYARSGIPADQPVTPPKRGNSSPAVAPTTGSNPTWPANLDSSAAPKSNKINSASYSHGVYFPTTLEPERVYSTPACHTDYVPSSGFLTLSTAFSSLERPVLFHAGNVHGISLSRGFPSLSGPSSSSPVDYPPGVSPPHCTVNSAMLGHPLLRKPNQGPTSRAFFASRALLRQRIRTAAGLLHPMHTADPLLSFLRLSRVSPSPSDHAAPA